MSLVIGLCGAKGSGKDQFYKAVKEAFPHLIVRKIAYADPIKDELGYIFNLNGETEYDQFKRTSLRFSLDDGYEHQVAGRQIVREIGMLMRRYDEDQFIKYVENKIAAMRAHIWCITDMRFNNELKSVRENLKGVVIKVKRKGFEYDGHATETEIPDDLCSSVINNNGTLEHFNSEVAREMSYILQTVSLVKE